MQPSRVAAFSSLTCPCSWLCAPLGLPATLAALSGLICPCPYCPSLQGFLPEEWDVWIQDTVYPSYSPTVIVFLACSSLYGLFKIGKLPGQKQL